MERYQRKICFDMYSRSEMIALSAKPPGANKLYVFECSTQFVLQSDKDRATGMKSNPVVAQR